jgi:hypothetical protein
MSEELNNNVDYIYGMIFSEPPDCRGPIDLTDDQAFPVQPVEEFIAKCADEHSLTKNANSPTYCDPTWDEVIGAAMHVQLSKAFLQRSDARLQHVTAKIRAMFGEHEDEAEEAIELAKAALDAEREAALTA